MTFQTFQKYVAPFMTCRNDHIKVFPNAYRNSQILHIQAIVNSVVDREGRIFVSHLHPRPRIYFRTSGLYDLLW